jgi:hypothetical protein
LTGSYPDMSSRELARERSHKHFVLVCKRRQYNVLNWSFQLIQQLSSSTTPLSFPQNLSLKTTQTLRNQISE